MLVHNSLRSQAETVLICYQYFATLTLFDCTNLTWISYKYSKSKTFKINYERCINNNNKVCLLFNNIAIYQLYETQTINQVGMFWDGHIVRTFEMTTNDHYQQTTHLYMI